MKHGSFLMQTKTLMEELEELEPEDGVFVIQAAEPTVYYDHSNVQIDLPELPAMLLHDFAKTIPEDELYITEDGEHGRVDRPHITVRYGMDTTDPAELTPAFKGIGPIHAKMGEVSIFERDEYDVIKVDVESLDLEEANKAIGRVVDLPGETFKEYKPHITIAYVKKGFGQKYVGDKRFMGMDVITDFVMLISKDGKEHHISLPFVSGLHIVTQAGHTGISHVKGGKPGQHSGTGGAIDVSDYPKDAKDITPEMGMAQAEYGDIKAQMSKDLSGIKTGNKDKIGVSGELNSDTSKSIVKNMKAELSQYSGYLAGDAANRARDYVDSFQESVNKGIKDGSLKGVKAEDLNALAQDNIKKMMYQEVESNRQAFTDHGVRHIAGNIIRQKEIMNAMKQDTTGKEELMTDFVMINHDVGYTVPLIREGGKRGVDMTKQHPAYSEKIMQQQKSQWNEDKIFTEKEYNKAAKLIRTHDSTEIDTKDWVTNSVRLSDNLSLFDSEKLPSMFRYVPDGAKHLVSLGEAVKSGDDNTFNTAKTALYKQIDSSNLSSALKRDLKSATGEISKVTPKFTLGVLAGNIDRIENKGGKLNINVKYNEYDSFLQQHFDMGQKQTKKLLEDYGHTDFTKMEYDIGDSVHLNISGAPLQANSENDKIKIITVQSKDQPRVPAGNPGGGQWASTGGGVGESQNDEDSLPISIKDMDALSDRFIAAQEGSRIITNMYLSKKDKPLFMRDDTDSDFYDDMYSKDIDPAIEFKKLSADSLLQRIQKEATPEQMDAYNRTFRGPNVLLYGDVGNDVGGDVEKGIIDNWASTSADTDRVAILMQLAAQEEFGLKDASIEHINKYAFISKGEERDTMMMAAKLVVRSMYNETQEQLAKQGIKEVTLYRGMRIEDYTSTLSKDIADKIYNTEPYKCVNKGGISFQPMSSFSGSPSTAIEFFGLDDHSELAVNAFTIIKVPASRILSTPASGFGCLSENEFIVLGGKNNNAMTVFSHEQASSLNSDKAFKEFVGLIKTDIKKLQ